MKKTVLIICLSAITTFGFSQINQSGDREEMVAPKAIDENADMVSANNKSKLATIQIVKAMLNSNFKKLDTNLLKNTVAMLGDCKKKGELFNNMRVVIVSTPVEAYKSENTEAGKKIAAALNDETDFKMYNSLLLKWQMLLKPAALGASWPTMEAAWKNNLK